MGRPHTRSVVAPAPPDRYEPLPGLVELPAWLWRRVGTRARVGVLIALALAVAGTVVLIPALSDSRRERAASDERQRAALQDRRIRALRAEQRPRYGRSDAAAPAAALDDLAAAIGADARRRVHAGSLDGPIRRVECEPFPRGADPAGGRFACLAVTADFKGGSFGHPYRAMIDFGTGRYAFCKISGRTDPTPHPQVTTPRACGG